MQSPLPPAVPAWVGPLLVGIVGTTITAGLMSVGTKLDSMTVQMAENKKVLEMLCGFMDEKKMLDRAQDERLRQIELRLQGMGR